jgi:pimeloyl-ACP methyl ester carboxylesterase
MAKETLCTHKITLDDTAHKINMERRDAFNRVVLDFLRKL